MIPLETHGGLKPSKTWCFLALLGKTFVTCDEMSCPLGCDEKSWFPSKRLTIFLDSSLATVQKSHAPPPWATVKLFPNGILRIYDRGGGIFLGGKKFF